MKADPDPSGLRGKSRVVIVDDHPIIRDLLAELINQEPDLVVCGAAEDACRAMAALTSLKPDVAVVDLTFKHGHGLELLRDIKDFGMAVPCLVFSMHEESVYAERALAAGAMGYITKRAATKEITEAIRTVLRGEVYLSPTMSAQVLKNFATGSASSVASPLKLLSDRELEVLDLIGQGQTPTKVAATLHLGIKTVETYLCRIKQKLNLKCASEVRKFAIEWLVKGKVD